jgi:hypothetical protein
MEERQKRGSEQCNLRRARPAIVGFEDGRRDHEPQNAGSVGNWKRQGNGAS